MSVWIETLGMALVLFAQIYRTKYGARIEIFLVFHQDLSLISHVIERARIEIILLKLSLYTMNNRTSHIGAWITTKGGRYAPTIEILLRTNPR